MIVFTQNISDRIKYILDYVLNDRMGLSLDIESDIDKFKAESGLKLNYSNQAIDGVFQIIPNGLLNETKLREDKPDVNISGEGIFLFGNESKDLNFDVFAACFWMITRYEEYQEFTADDHDRYPSTNSLAYKHEFLKRPVVDEWIVLFKEKLLAFYGDINLKKEEFSVIPTIDIDSPWCYKNKGLIRNAGGLTRDVIRSEFSEISERFKVFAGLKKDAHDQFNWLNDTFKKFSLKPIYFILVGKYGKFDKTINRNKQAFKSFLNKISSDNTIGVHPSYNASDNFEVLEDELNYLAEQSNTIITKSRQHFLKFTLPNYYQHLIRAGISHDYSMGYADHIGFRAGTSRPFKFFNLVTNKMENLLIHPFSVMDVTLQQYRKFTPDQAIEEINTLITNIKQVNGEFISLWHNESLSERKEWIGWKNVYITMLDKALQ